MAEDQRVTIVGAGPTGLTSALALDAHGIPVTLLEADPLDRDRPGSRAIYIHGSSMRSLERVSPGLGQQIAEDGLTWPTRKTCYRGKEVFSRTYENPGGSGELPRFTSLPQVDTEDLMLEACRDRGIDIRWDSAVETVEADDDRVRVETEGGEAYESAYAIGADGGGSTVRREIGVDFEGSQTEGAFIIADVSEDPDNPREIARTFHYEDPDMGGRNVLLAPFKGGWRVDFQCKPSDDPDEMRKEETVSEMVASTLGERYRDRVNWISYYEFSEALADQFVDDHRRVLLAGDAAHIFPPFGARGMNSGIADAYEAGSTIASALRAEYSGLRQDELELYAARRERAARFNRNSALRGLAHLREESLTIRLKKRLAAAAAKYWDAAGEWLDDAPYGSHASPPIVSTAKY